ncbi:MAG TPA: hypothetical protein VHY91_16120 [Pirellulales bacterium]|nr:hypothetical protein [Pirellulales bacterium]
MSTVALAGEPAQAAQPASPEQIAAWVADLDASSFATREAATRRLIRAGMAAVPVLAELGDSTGSKSSFGPRSVASLERIDRTLSILSAACSEGNSQTSAAALSAIERLSLSADGRLALRAREALGRERAWQQQLAIQTIERLGATVQCADGGDADALGDVEDPEACTAISVHLTSAWRGGDTGVATLVTISSLHVLSFENSRITDAALPHLAGLSQVKRLYLGPSHMRAVGLHCLTGLPALRHLSLRGLSLADPAYAQLAELQQLESLGLDETPLTDDQLGQVARLTSLRSLWLNGTHLTDDGFCRLAPLVNLTHIELAHTAINGSRLAALKPLTQLRFLTLEDTAVDDRAARQLGELTQITELGLDHTRITDAGLADLAKLVHLEKLWLSGTTVSDAGIARLGTLKQLRSLHLEETAVTDAGVAALGQLLPDADISR